MNFEAAARRAIALTKARNLPEVGADELLLGLLEEVSRFGVACLGPYIFDLGELGIDWLRPYENDISRVIYSQKVVDLFDKAAQIARSDASSGVRVEHALAAYADETEGLMGHLKLTYLISSSAWRAAVAQLRTRSEAEELQALNASYLTPEQAAEALNVHVQTVRAYVRTGKLPAMRLAGERAIRIKRTDLETLLEPLAGGPAPSIQ